jgi:CRISPR/Cas system-associated endonuclease/helicase Cas3
MKNTKTKKPKEKVIKELAQHFEADLNRMLPISIQPNGDIVFENYYIKRNAAENWELRHKSTNDFVDQFFLKTSALMAAKAYNKTQLDRYFEVKRLDTQYWANYCDTIVYRNNIKKAKDFSRYLVLLNKLEHTEFLTEHYKETISRMFKWSFV